MNWHLTVKIFGTSYMRNKMGCHWFFKSVFHMRKSVNGYFQGRRITWQPSNVDGHGKEARQAWRERQLQGHRDNFLVSLFFIDHIFTRIFIAKYFYFQNPKDLWFIFLIHISFQQTTLWYHKYLANSPLLSYFP